MTTTFRPMIIGNGMGKVLDKEKFWDVLRQPVIRSCENCARTTGRFALNGIQTCSHAIGVHCKSSTYKPKEHDIPEYDYWEWDGESS